MQVAKAFIKRITDSKVIVAAVMALGITAAMSSFAAGPQQLDKAVQNGVLTTLNGHRCYGGSTDQSVDIKSVKNGYVFAVVSHYPNSNEYVPCISLLKQKGHNNSAFEVLWNKADKPDAKWLKGHIKPDSVSNAVQSYHLVDSGKLVVETYLEKDNQEGLTNPNPLPCVGGGGAIDCLTGGLHFDATCKDMDSHNTSFSSATNDDNQKNEYGTSTSKVAEKSTDRCSVHFADTVQGPSNGGNCYVLVSPATKVVDPIRPGDKRLVGFAWRIDNSHFSSGKCVSSAHKR